MTGAVEETPATMMAALPPPLLELVDRARQIPNVVAVTLGGSRASGTAGPTSDWDLGLYYRETIDPAAVRALGFPGHVAAPGEWGRIVNGGAWLMVTGTRVDLLYREIGAVGRWLAAAEAGRFAVDRVAGHIAGLPTYVLAGELALGQVLAGALPWPRPAFPAALRASAPPWWRGSAAFALVGAESYAARGAVVGGVGLLASAVLAEAHARLAERGEWALNEKRLVSRAGLTEADHVLAAAGETPAALTASVARLRALLGIPAPAGLQFDAARR